MGTGKRAGFLRKVAQGMTEKQADALIVVAIVLALIGWAIHTLHERGWI